MLRWWVWIRKGSTGGSTSRDPRSTDAPTWFRVGFVTIVVMKALLRQAIDREHEAQTLRTELGEVI
jgi:hypothetical protein